MNPTAEIGSSKVKSKDYRKMKRKQCFASLNVKRGGSAGAKGT